PRSCTPRRRRSTGATSAPAAGARARCRTRSTRAAGARSTPRATDACARAARARGRPRPLRPREREGVAEAMDHDRSARDGDTRPGAPQPPAQVDVLARAEPRVEPVPEQRLALEDGGGDAEPVLAAPGTVVLDERLPPVPRAGDAA